MVTLLTGGPLYGWLVGPLVGWLVTLLTGEPLEDWLVGPADWSVSGRLAGRSCAFVQGWLVAQLTGVGLLNSERWAFWKVGWWSLNHLNHLAWTTDIILYGMTLREANLFRGMR